MEDTITQEIATIPVEDFKALAEAAPIALQKNSALLEKARAKSNELREIIESGHMDDEVDLALNDHMINLTKAEELCNSRRTPFTRMIQGAVKVFTSIEKWFKDEKDFFQKKRDEYAAQKLREKREKEAEAARKLAMDKERVEVKAKLESECQRNFLRDIESAKGVFITRFNQVTLANYDKALEWFKKQTVEYTQVLFTATNFYTGSNLLSADQVIELSKTVLEGKFEGFKARYESEVGDLLTNLIDRLPGKKKELEEIAAKEEEARRLQLAAKTKAEKEAAEAARLAAEKQKEEAEDRRRQQEQAAAVAAEKAQREAEAKVELAKEVEMTNTLFDHDANNAVISADLPEGREGYEITIIHPAGYVELMNFWWKHEGAKLGIADVPGLEKKTFKQLKSFAEKQAQKNDLKIESKFIAYTEVFKTQAKK